jgi:hypothetical protein
MGSPDRKHGTARAWNGACLGEAVTHQRKRYRFQAQRTNALEGTGAVRS